MKFRTAASIAVLGIASALGLPAQAETGAQVHVGPPAMRVAGLSGQPQQKATPPPAQSQGGQPDQKAPTQAQREGGQNDQKQAGTIQAKEPEMILVSNLWNASVYGPDEQRIGDINDIIIKSDGKIEGVIVGVGGFLGVGEKNVALRLDRFKVTPEADGRARITISTTKEELQQSPEFKTKQDRG